jgi:hypothetical protein
LPQENKKRLILLLDQALLEEKLARLAAASLAAFTATSAVSTASAVTAAAAAAVTATTTAATGRAGLAWPRFVHGQRSAFDSFAVKLRNRVLRFLVGAHRDKSESARLAGELILHQHDFLHGAGLREEFLQFVFRRVEGEISYV